jgi:hypothetical protein
VGSASALLSPEPGSLPLGPPMAGLLPVAPLWQSLGLGALHPLLVTCHWPPCPSLQDSSWGEDQGTVGQASL